MASALAILLGLGAAYGAFRRGRQEKEDRRLQRDYYRSQRDAAEADRQQRRRDEIAQPVEQLAQLYPTAAPQLYQRSADLRRGTYLPGAPSAAEQLDSDPAAQISLPFTTPAAASGQRSGSLLGGVALGPSRYDLQRRATQDRDAAERAAAERADAVRGGLATFGALTHGRVGADPAEIARLGQQAVSGKPLAPNPALLGRTESEVDSERRTAEAKAREIRDRQNQRLRIAGGLITSLKGVNDNYRQTLSTVLAQGGDVSDQLSTFLRQGGILPPSILADIARWQADPDPNAPLPRSLQQLAGFDALVDQSGGAPPPAPIAPPPLTGAGPRPGGLNPTLWNNLTSSGSTATVAAGPPPTPPSALPERRPLFPQGTEAQSRIADRPIGRQIQQQRAADQKAAAALSTQDRRVRIELEKQRLQQQRLQQQQTNADRAAGRDIQRERNAIYARRGSGSNGRISQVETTKRQVAERQLDQLTEAFKNYTGNIEFGAEKREWLNYLHDPSRRQKLRSDIESGRNKNADHIQADKLLREIEKATAALDAIYQSQGVDPRAPAGSGGQYSDEVAQLYNQQLGAGGWSPDLRQERIDALRYAEREAKRPLTDAEKRTLFERVERKRRAQ